MLRRISTGFSTSSDDSKPTKLSSRAQEFVNELHQKHPNLMNFDTIRQRLVKSIEEGEAKLEAPGGVDNALTRMHLNIYRKQLKELDANFQLTVNQLTNRFGLSLDDIKSYWEELNAGAQGEGARRKRGFSFRSLEKAHTRFFPTNRRDSYWC